MPKEIDWDHESPMVIDKNDDSLRDYGLGSGYDIVGLSDEHIEAMRSGKCLACDNGEYSTFIIFTPS